MDFSRTKASMLSRTDKSNKGSIDLPIRKLIECINKSQEYCTTSSCSGRSVIFAQSKSGRKNDFDFLFVSHDKIRTEELQAAITKNAGNSWFRFEPMIIHVSCASVDAASKLLTVSRQVCKHSGILSMGNFPVIEIRGSEFIEAPLKIKGERVSDKMVKFLCASANKKLGKTHERIRKLVNLIAEKKHH